MYILFQMFHFSLKRSFKNCNEQVLAAANLHKVSLIPSILKKHGPIFIKLLVVLLINTRLLKPPFNIYTTRSSNYISLAIPRKKTTYSCSELLKLQTIIPVCALVSALTSTCKCFN